MNIEQMNIERGRWVWHFGMPGGAPVSYLLLAHKKDFAFDWTAEFIQPIKKYA